MDFKETVKEWIYRPELKDRLYFFTLTPDRNCSAEQFKAALVLWLRKIRQMYFGRRRQPEVFHLVMFEKTYQDRLHAHALVEDFSTVATEKPFPVTGEFSGVAMAAWLGLDLAGKRIAQDVQKVYLHEGALDYVLKDLWSSKNFENLPLDLLSLPPKYSTHPHVPIGDKK